MMYGKNWFAFFLSLFLFLAAGVLLIHAAAVGERYYLFLYELFAAAVFFAAALAAGWTWCDFEHWNHVLWENTARDQEGLNDYRRAQLIADMAPERLEIWLHMEELKAYQKAYDAVDDPNIKQQVLTRIDDAVERMGNIEYRMRNAAQAIAGYEDVSSVRRYAMEAMNYARGNPHGWLPALHPSKDKNGKRTGTNEGSPERKALQEFYRRLVIAKAAEPAIGPKPNRVVDWELAEQIARGMQQW